LQAAVAAVALVFIGLGTATVEVWLALVVHLALPLLQAVLTHLVALAVLRTHRQTPTETESTKPPVHHLTGVGAVVCHPPAGEAATGVLLVTLVVLWTETTTTLVTRVAQAVLRFLETVTSLGLPLVQDTALLHNP
jgi:hypothetical protein